METRAFSPARAPSMDHLIETFEPHDEDGAARSYDHIIGVPVHHRASVTHELIAGAAGFTAMKMYEDHLRASGEEPSHSLMKEILAGIAAAEVDKLVETKGLDHLDRHRAKRLAQRQAERLAEDRYGHGRTGWEYARARPGAAVQYAFPAYAPGFYAPTYGASPYPGAQYPQPAYAYVAQPPPAEPYGQPY